ncbi:hypothetical protein EYF80_026310 [Liparis tanakae]|uniref:Uncharacterized protein n=1 Tax=Liparis tanakae TaxID=230148 RepID=A0A4Z2HD72_9TELE|nr:hypothetical protein EYF80_026310 [Liparis tanakae]
MLAMQFSDRSWSSSRLSCSLSWLESDRRALSFAAQRENCFSTSGDEPPSRQLSGASGVNGAASAERDTGGKTGSSLRLVEPGADEPI